MLEGQLTNIIMRHIKRNKKGQYTHRHTGRKMFVLGLLASIAFGTYAEMQKIVVPEVEAHIATTTPDIITEIVDVPDISPEQVALWFVDNDVKLLTAFRDNDLDAVEDIIQERHSYAMAVALKSYDNDTK
jgi:hypothetical protein